MAAGMFRGAANHMGVGPRPSESHNWVPGLGWVFQPAFAEGESLRDQGDGAANYNPKVAGNSVADAAASGVTNYSVGDQGRASFGDMGRTAEDMARVRQRQASQDWYSSGMDHYSGPYDEEAMLTWYNDRTGRKNISPWFNTNDLEREGVWNAVKGSDYNAFLGGEGGFINDAANLGSRNEGYRDDSIAGWFKDAFAGDDMVQHRKSAINDLRMWNEKEGMGGYGLNKATDRMTKAYFDQMQLGDKYGLKWSGPSSEAGDMLAGGGGGGGLSQAAEMLNRGMMSGGGEAVRDVIYGKAQEKIFGE